MVVQKKSNLTLHTVDTSLELLFLISERVYIAPKTEW